MSQDDINRQAFREEATDLLAELESALLELEEEPDDRDLIDRVFRAMHTIKGSGAMFGFDDIAAFTHDVETVFDRVRNGQMEVSRELLDLTLSARDNIAYLLDCAEQGEQPDLERSRDITEGLRALLPEDARAPGRVEEKTATESKHATATYRVRFKPNQDFFLSGANPLGLLEELCELGPCKTFLHLEDMPRLEDYVPDSLYVWWDVILSTDKGADAVHDVFMFAEDDCELLVQAIDLEGTIDEDAEYKKLGEILVERGDLKPEELKAILDEKQKLGDLLAERGVVSKDKVESALMEQQTVREMRKSRPAPSAPKTAVVEAPSSIRVAADKLDILVDLVGELVIVQAQISQMVSEKHDPNLTVLAEELERLSDELRDSTLGIRMLPIGTTFSKFRRLVRDLSAELGKQINLQTEGAETELDKTVIERLNDPLVHLLRNSIDHGVETPEERTAQGKPEAGTILLAAEHSGGEVHIRIVDDGKGMDPEAIRAKAVERGIITPDAELSEQETFNLIFQPGFSTAAQVTNVSGRGVGMDVVKRGIDSLRGSVTVDSKLGKGTTITVKLPLTLAIIDGLQVQVGGEFFVMPLSMVEECVELLRKEHEDEKQQIVNLRGDIVPYIRLRECFQVEGASPDIEQIVVVGVDSGRYGIVVDNVIGEHQTVIKSLGRVYRDVEGISGATIKGDGSMALILDIPKLISREADAVG